MICKWVLAALLAGKCLVALEKTDQSAIEAIIQDYTTAWNEQECKGFGDHFAQNAEFVNIFGMKFVGKAEIEQRHVQILQGFLKDSKLKILSTEMREVQPGVVVATIDWSLDGFRNPGEESKQVRDGIFTQVFVQAGEKWEIVASQNTLKRK